MLGGGDFPTENTTAWGCLAFLFENSFIEGRVFPCPLISVSFLAGKLAESYPLKK